MFLFVTIAIICLLLTFAPDIVKLLQIPKWIAAAQGTSSSDNLQTQLTQARAELERVRRTPNASGEYAQLVKTMRAEQKLKNIEEKMSAERSKDRLKGYSVELIAGYAVKALLSLILVVISVTNRYTPVMVFHDRFNFQPLEGLLSFPTGVHNAVSVPVWVLSCNVTFRLVSGLVKGKK